jgi:hypothetical protein
VLADSPVPQALKPDSNWGSIGTTEVVPGYETVGNRITLLVVTSRPTQNERAIWVYFPISSRYFSTSRAAMQPVPAAVTAWR